MKANNYKPFDTISHNWLNDEVICNGCGTKMISYDMSKHLKTCLISNLRISLSHKSCGKLSFTKVRE